MPDSQYFHSNGKLLLSGEYFVLDSAVALAIPTKFGQSLFVRQNSEKQISWRSLDEKNEKWFFGRFDLEHLESIESNDLEIAENLVKIFAYIKAIKPTLFEIGWDFQTRLEFPKNWGLGTSSTFIANLAKWANIDAYELLANSFGGSGYDIACAFNNQPLFFSQKSEARSITLLDWAPIFSQNIYFIYLEKKKNSREGIQSYRNKGLAPSSFIDEISDISNTLVDTNSQTTFCAAIEKHEEIISTYLGIEKVKSLYFSDFFGSIKSLGAWGGDFIMAVSEMNATETKAYFNKKGYSTILSWNEMVL